MATDTRQVYVCDKCEDEEDEDSVCGEESWVEVYYNGQSLQFCRGCWSFV